MSIRTQIPTVAMNAFDPEGHLIGVVDRVFAGEDGRTPEWVAVRTALPDAPDVFVSLLGADVDPSAATTGLRLAYARDAIQGSPFVADASVLSDETAHVLEEYYLGARGDTNPTRSGSRSRDVATQSVVERSEERLHVTTVARPAERVRLEKFIVSEERTISVTVRHEEFRLVRGLEPLPANRSRHAGTSASVGAIDDVSVVLHEERLVITRDVVPVERVRLRGTVVTEDRAVDATLRTERVEVTEDRAPSRAQEHAR